ncbi:MAG: DUF488 domain-containing protein [Bacteroidales bacterium]|nr:DUF488 domain-containing protein [Bacteroidales bacterium]
MFYRRKVILALLEVFENKIDKISFQKLLFLFTRMQDKPSYHFVPYKQGCFSFQSYADLRTMMKYGQVSEGKDQWIKTCSINYASSLNNEDQEALKVIKNQYGNFSSNELIELTYRNFPYYAVKSTIAGKFLTIEEQIALTKSIPEIGHTTLFTIGYEGLSLEEYFNKLILNNIQVLCDVRKNPVSMKYGFSKNQLQRTCENLDIKYLHIPELGIESDKRKGLASKNDYDGLFQDYKEITLKENNNAINQLFDLLKQNKCIALTCFEANPLQCHRSRLANAIVDLPGWEFELKHL